MTNVALVEQIKEHCRELLKNSPVESWPKEITFDEPFPIEKARIHENGDVDVMPRCPAQWIEFTISLDSPVKKALKQENELAALMAKVKFED